MDSERPRPAKKKKNDLKAFCKEWNTKLCPFASREDRKSRAKLFLNYEAKYQKHYPVIKAWTWPDAAEDPPLLNEKWLGITLVALHINDWFCVVALADDLEQLENGLLRDDGDMTTCEMWNALVDEVEGIEERSFDRSCKTPFSVVTLDMSGDEASSAEVRAKMSCKFLQNEMKSGETFTFDKTIQTTISAFQHLFGREVKADEIRAFARKDGRTLGKELKQWRKTPDLDELLVSINEPYNDDPDTLTTKKGVAARLTCEFFKKGDGSSFSGKGKALEEFIRKIVKRQKKKEKERRERRRKRREKVSKLRSKKARKEIGDAQDSVEHCAKSDEKVEMKRRKKVRKLRSKKARKEIGDALEHCAIYDVARENVDLDNDTVMQEANMEKELEL